MKKRKSRSEVQVNVYIPEKLARDVENLIKDRSELDFENVDEFVVNAVSLFLHTRSDRVRTVK